MELHKDAVPTVFHCYSEAARLLGEAQQRLALAACEINRVENAKLASDLICNAQAFVNSARNRV